MSAETFDYAPSSSTLSGRLPKLHEETKKALDMFGFSYTKELSLLADLVYQYLSIESLCIANLIHMFLYILDDQVDVHQNDLSQTSEKLELLNKCMRVLDGELAIDNLPIIQLMNYSLSKLHNKVLKSYVIDQIRDYITGVIKHIELNNEILTVEEYTEIRLLDGACEVVWPLCFLDHPNVESIVAYLKSDEGKHMRLLANKNVSFHNDVTSLKKDKKDGTTFNLVLCYKNQCNMTEDEATALVVGICNRTYRELENMSVGNEIADKLANWCRFSLAWHLLAHRNK